MKSELRKKAKEKLNSLAEDKVVDWSAEIAEKLFLTPEFIYAERVFVYKSFGKEVKTNLIVDECLRRGKKVCVPKIDGEKMYSIALETISGYYVDEYGISEPVDGAEVEPDLVIMPLLAFDAEKNRLGRGKGYYDKYCASDFCATVALAFDAQKVESVPVDEWDYVPDMIISEKEVIE